MINPKISSYACSEETTVALKAPPLKISKRACFSKGGVFYWRCKQTVADGHGCSHS